MTDPVERPEAETTAAEREFLRLWAENERNGEPWVRDSVGELLRDLARAEARANEATARADRLAGEIAELRGRVAKAVNHIQRTADRIANRDDMPYGDRDFRELRGAVRAAVLLLTEPEAKGGAAPAQEKRP